MTLLTRLPDWEDRLHALLVARRAEPFAFGSHDCALFGADVVLALTGVDHGAPFRGRYGDAVGAAAALREVGRGTLTRTFDRHLPRRAPALLRRGDLSMLGRGRSAAIGVVVGAEALFIGEHGLEPRARGAWSRGWGVG